MGDGFKVVVDTGNGLGNLRDIADLHQGPSTKDVFPNFIFLGYPPFPCLLKSTSERLLFGHFLYPPPSPFGKMSFMDGSLSTSAIFQTNPQRSQYFERTFKNFQPLPIKMHSIARPCDWSKVWKAGAPVLPKTNTNL